MALGSKEEGGDQHIIVVIEKPWKDHFFFMSMYKTIWHDK
jgi:hypothetical protein